MTENIITKTYTVDMNKWYKCGNFAINKNTLSKNKLTCKYWKNLNSLQSYPPLRLVKTISNKCVDFLMEILTNKEKFDMSLFFDLDGEEQKLMIYLLEKSQYGKQIGFNFGEAYKNRMKIIQGELSSGNDNEELIKEAISVVKILMSYHLISFQQGNEMIKELEEE